MQLKNISQINKSHKGAGETPVFTPMCIQLDYCNDFEDCKSSAVIRGRRVCLRKIDERYEIYEYYSHTATDCPHCDPNDIEKLDRESEKRITTFTASSDEVAAKVFEMYVEAEYFTSKEADNEELARIEEAYRKASETADFEKYFEEHVDDEVYKILVKLLEPVHIIADTIDVEVYRISDDKHPLSANYLLYIDSPDEDIFLIPLPHVYKS